MIPSRRCVAHRHPRGVAVHREGAGLAQVLAAGDELRARDVQCDQAAGTGHLGDQGVLSAKAVPDVEDVTAGRQVFGELADEPANGDGRLGRDRCHPPPRDRG